MLQQIGAHLGWVGTGFVDFVDGNDHRHLRRLGVVNRLNRLRHNSVICRNNQHNDICHMRTARPHCGKGRVAGRIQKRQLCAAFGCHLIRADMLGNAAGLARDNRRFTDGIQERCFAVVNMAHDRDDGWAGLQQRRIIDHRINHLFHIRI